MIVNNVSFSIHPNCIADIVKVGMAEIRFRSTVAWEALKTTEVG